MYLVFVSTALVMLIRWLIKKLEMGSLLSYFWWGGDPDEVSPVSGLSRREVYVIQKSWAPVNANMVANGSELFRRLFSTFPQTKDYFKMIKNQTEEQYSQNPQFKAHVINLMTSINLAVNTMNQPELVAAMMNKIGESHHRRRIKEQNFHELKEVIVKMFIDVLKMDDATLGAWSKTVDFWYKHIFETLTQPEGTR
ncbi:globin-like isoform X2 [Anticarsia gemmatalis]|uniref:globin-like isoform X2 n=1 Tax=Anticarsia gemmatalis TaxID=129554 RepID=UPI003F75FD81